MAKKHIHRRSGGMKMTHYPMRRECTERYARFDWYEHGFPGNGDRMRNVPDGMIAHPNEMHTERCNGEEG